MGLITSLSTDRCNHVCISLCAIFYRIEGMIHDVENYQQGYSLSGIH